MKEKKGKNGYTLQKQWFDFVEGNEGKKIMPVHTSLWFWLVELNNRLGWKETFGVPTDKAMLMTSIKSYNTFKRAVNDLVKWGFLSLVTKSKNQHSANIYSLNILDSASSKIDKANDSAPSKFDTPIDTAEQSASSNFDSHSRHNKTIINITENYKTFFSEKTISLFLQYLQLKKEDSPMRAEALMELLVTYSEKDDTYAAGIINKAMAGNYPSFAPLTKDDKAALLKNYYIPNITLAKPDRNPDAKPQKPPPELKVTKEEVRSFFKENGYKEKIADRCFESIDLRGWSPKWKDWARQYYFKPENELPKMPC